MDIYRSCITGFFGISIPLYIVSIIALNNPTYLTSETSIIIMLIVASVCLLFGIASVCCYQDFKRRYYCEI